MAEEKGDPVTGRVSKGTDFSKWWDSSVQTLDKAQ